LPRRRRRMSYGFRLFLPQPGADPLAAAAAGPDEEGGGVNPDPPVVGNECRKRVIADALTRADPALEVSLSGCEETAEFQDASAEEAEVRRRYMELNGPEGGPGIQIALLDDGASLTVASWHKGGKAKAVFAQIWECLRVM